MLRKLYQDKIFTIITTVNMMTRYCGDDYQNIHICYNTLCVCDTFHDHSLVYVLFSYERYEKEMNLIAFIRNIYSR